MLAAPKLRWIAAIRIAAQTPVQLEAARAGERQARARYQSGLQTLTELADAQRLLTQRRDRRCSRTLECLARTLALRRAQGDLQPFLEQVTK